MNKKYSLQGTIALVILCLVLASCTKERLVPSDLDQNLFEAYESHSSIENKLRHDFHKDTGCYLLFSDTLKRGEQIEVIDLRYTVTITGDYYFDKKYNFQDFIYEFDYITDDQKKSEAVNFLREKIVKYTSPAALPYSFLLVDSIFLYGYKKKLDEYDRENPQKGITFVQGLYTSAIAGFGEMKEKDEKTQKAAQLEVLNTMVKTSLSKVEDDKFEEFYSYCLEYYDKNYDSNNIDEMPDATDIRELGFLKSYSFRPGKRMSFHPQKRDKEAFIDELLSKPESEWREEHKDFPLVLRKLEILSKITTSLGYDLSYL